MRRGAEPLVRPGVVLSSVRILPPLTSRRTLALETPLCTQRVLQGYRQGIRLPTAVLLRRQYDAPTSFDRYRNRRRFRLRLCWLTALHNGLAPDGRFAQQHRNTALVERLLDVTVDLPIAAGFILGERADFHATPNRAQVFKTIGLEGELPPAVTQADLGVLASVKISGGLLH